MFDLLFSSKLPIIPSLNMPFYTYGKKLRAEQLGFEVTIV
jgi:hypothetical protein